VKLKDAELAETLRRRAETAEAERDAARLVVEELQTLRDSLYGHLDSAQQRTDTAEAAIERIERLRDKWLAYPADDMHYAAGLMLDRHLSGEAFAADERLRG
jgi:hypothetical protein